MSADKESMKIPPGFKQLIYKGSSSLIEILHPDENDLLEAVCYQDLHHREGNKSPTGTYTGGFFTRLVHCFYESSSDKVPQGLSGPPLIPISL